MSNTSDAERADDAEGRRRQRDRVGRAAEGDLLGRVGERVLEVVHFDTSATKWQVREVSARAEAVRGLICRHPGRFLFGSDLVTRPGLTAGHYESRYWCQRTLWESAWEGRSPIDDPDYAPATGEPSTPPLRGDRPAPGGAAAGLPRQRVTPPSRADRGPVKQVRPRVRRHPSWRAE